MYNFAEEELQFLNKISYGVQSRIKGGRIIKLSKPGYKSRAVYSTQINRSKTAESVRYSRQQFSR